MEGTYRPASARGSVAIALLLLMALLAAISALHFLSAFDLADRAARSALRPGEAAAFDDLTQTLGRLELAGLILTGIAWFVWLHRSVANARSLGVQTEATPGWSVGWWFIPFANLVKPYRAAGSSDSGGGATSSRASSRNSRRCSVRRPWPPSASTRGVSFWPTHCGLSPRSSRHEWCGPSTKGSTTSRKPGRCRAPWLSDRRAKLRHVDDEGEGAGDRTR